ncbi:hypothetical protein BC829DRAFT_386593 [Chytridium lagenaria]|nr:hypothetical protein BC829DRAFT_386593 [Chytridium lagenaria]
MTDDDGQTPLHHAARSGAPEAVLTRLIKYIPHSQDAKKKRQDIIDDATLRRRLEARDGGSRTALHWAAMNGHRGAVKVLLELGADVGAQDGEGEDAVGIAERLARCGAAERGGGVRSSVFGDIARMVGGRGTTKNVSKYLVKT